MSILKSIRERSTIEKAVGIRVSQDADGTPVIETHKTDQIKTLDQLLDASDVDKSEWEVKNWTSNVWNQMSTANGLVPLWQVKAQLQRKDLSQKNVNEIIAKGWAAFKRGISTTMPNAAKPCASGAGVMVEFAIPDLHLGKLAWNPETGHGNYDLEIAVTAHREALTDLIKRAPRAEEAWFVVGNDFFNVDNKDRTTTNGTQQDEDGRWQKTFVRGKELLMESIGMLRKKYPNVHVIVMPGNHDRQRAFYVGECLVEAFKGVNGVTIDNRPLFRKYRKWGDTGFGYAHGDGLKAKDIPYLCQQEARQIWGETSRFEFHIGHYHQEIQRWLGSVLCRVLPSLTPPDAWHCSKGYTMVEKAAMALVYNQRGLDTQIVHYPRKELFF